MNSELEKQKKFNRSLTIEGLGGWLILVQIGLYLTLLLIGYYSATGTIPILLDSEFWTVLTSPDLEFYHPAVGPIIIFEAAYNFLLFGFIIYILICFYQKKWIVPRLMIIFYSLSFLLAVADAFLVFNIPFLRELDEGETMRDLGRSAMTCAIWIPYFRKSVRVQNTFVR
ncbi:DUF2569 domain-containing protein [Paenibacillus daejeonensis]|uniref:DUF2569 domain-containing protein n=1 Tax=Paenibacillus daejeonensis TaxID=135193 RepID=UPI00037F8159|nr:DUF2569 domain-containing protein [Paenibacillus daejeonensis]